jgi:hypothetical protein
MIRDALTELDHELITFNLPLSVQQLYSEAYPDDSGQNNIMNIKKFEDKNPDSFVTMYNFWSQKCS